MNADIQKLTQLANIRHIFYVDDDFSGYDLYKEPCYARCRDIKDADKQLPFECDTVNFENQFDNWWKSGLDIHKFISEQAISRKETQIESNLYSLCEGGINIHCIAPEQYIEQIREKLEGIPQEENILFLVDKELNGHADSNRIVDFLRSIPNKYIALFSETFQPEEEISTWLNDNHPKDVYPLAKQRLDNNSFVEGVRNVIWLKDISSLKIRTIDLLQDSIKKVTKKLESIDPSTFDKTIMDVSKDEGCWEFETLYRIILSMLNQEVQEYMIADENFAHFQEITHNIRNIKETLPNIQNNPIDKEKIQSIQESEWYYSGNYLNSVFSPIQNGDIFTIGQKKYMLLCQPCNLAVRDQGKRSHDLDYAYLIPIRNTNEIKIYHEEIKTLSPNRECADFTNCKRISLDLLDLVSYNEEGISKIDINVAEIQDYRKNILQQNMLRRYHKVWEKINKYYQVYKSIQDSPMGRIEKEICLNFLKRPYEMGDSTLVKVPIHTANNSIFSFSIQRISRYKEPFVQDLLQKFMRYLSRPGFAPQLTDTE